MAQSASRFGEIGKINFQIDSDEIKNMKQKILHQFETFTLVRSRHSHGNCALLNRKQRRVT